METNGFSVQVEDVQDLNRIKDEKQVPPLLRSCHTAVVDGYIIEGHVSVAEIERLNRFRHFLSPHVAEIVASQGGETLLQSHRSWNGVRVIGRADGNGINRLAHFVEHLTAIVVLLCRAISSCRLVQTVFIDVADGNDVSFT